MLKLIIILTLLSIVNTSDDIQPCPGVDFITGDVVNFLIYGSYAIHINKEFKNGTEVDIKLNSNASVSVKEDLLSLTELGNNKYNLIILKPTNEVVIFIGKQKTSDFVVALESVKIDGTEECDKSLFKPFVSLNANSDNEQENTGRKAIKCGRRKINHNKLIVFGGVTKPGDWPWHVALNSIQGSIFKYICGGTLISETTVLTAAHCVTKRGIAVVPESLGISLGRHNLIGGDDDPQERQVFKVIVHEDFSYKNLNNDIALLKLSTPAVYNDYVQAACMWYDIDIKSLPSENITGVVVGWGFDQSDLLSPDLRFANMPLVSDRTCIQRNPFFYGNFLNGKRFCAGVLNGTSACNGDSGGSFSVFIPDTPGDSSSAEGIWAVRGIVSIAYSRQNDNRNICDPNEYVLFTDVNEYKDWIIDHIK